MSHHHTPLKGNLMTEQTIAAPGMGTYVCALCGYEQQLPPNAVFQCQRDGAHKVLFKKRAEDKPLVYKCI